ncbi:hypothetical protein [Amycolatopsis pittospori]|uniref:hypothetical protein n=1 Tax=Amycolatopsis pittospori TaxID=2749434 RepID=UPI0015F09BF9|nr:hypothetical protein [Amycolatopsis pittospori]
MHGRTGAAGQIARHAGNIAAARLRFAAVHDASSAIAGADGAYGRLCRWVTENFQEKHTRQDELVEFVEENLRLIGDTLSDETPVSDPVRVAASPSLIAPVTIRPMARAGWRIEDVEPLRDVLDRLTGEPDVIASHAATWCNIAVELAAIADELEDFVEFDISGWYGDEADEHRRLMGNNIEAIKGLSSISAALAEITESVGVLVAQTRRIVHDLIADLLTVSVSAPRARTFTRWAGRIAVYAVALDTTLTHLNEHLNG